MKKCFAIPMKNGVLSSHFGHCESFAIINVEDNKIIDIKEVAPPQHIPGAYPRFIAQFGATDVIGGGMGSQAISLFNQQDISVFVGAPTENAEVLVNDFLANKLNLNANYCNHDENHEHGDNCDH